MSSRVTNSMLISNFNRNLNRNVYGMQKYQNQIATNKKIARLSDDPVGVVKSLSSRTKISDIQQFEKNIQDAQSLLTQQEQSINELNSIVTRAYELAVYASNDTKAPEDLGAIAKEIKELRDQVVTVGNSVLGDKYLFGGHNVTKEPFVVDDYGELTFNGLSLVDEGVSEDIDLLNQPVIFEVGFDIKMEVTLQGASVMGIGEKNIYNTMDQFYRTLMNIDKDGNALEGEDLMTFDDIQPFIGHFKSLQTDLLDHATELGGRQNRLELMAERFSQDELNYTKMKSDAEDLDLAESIMWFSMAEAVYRAALGVGGRILQPTLMDFLR